MHLQQFTGMQSSKRGIWKGYHLSIERIRKGYLFREKCYRKGYWVGPRSRPPRIPPPPPVPGPVPCEQSLRLSLGNFKQQLRLREQQLKSEFALPQTLSGLFRLVKFVLWGPIVSELNCEGFYSSPWKERKICAVVFPSATKREIRHFHAVVAQ